MARDHRPEGESWSQGRLQECHQATPVSTPGPAWDLRISIGRSLRQQPASLSWSPGLLRAGPHDSLESLSLICVISGSLSTGKSSLAELETAPATPHTSPLHPEPQPQQEGPVVRALSDPVPRLRLHALCTRSFSGTHTSLSESLVKCGARKQNWQRHCFSKPAPHPPFLHP